MPKISRPLLIDSLVATVLVFGVCFLLKWIVFETEFMNPVEGALHYAGEEFSNSVYDNARASTGPAASTLCLVDIGEASRTQIAAILNVIADQRPHLVAVDVMFDKKNMPVDTSLQLALRRLAQQQKLVMASWVSIEGEKGAERLKRYESDAPYRIGPTGYINFVAKEINGVVRHHLPQLYDTTATLLSFAAQVVSMAAPQTWQTYEKHQAALGRYEPDWILYQNDQTVFRRLEAGDLKPGNAQLTELTDKIVLVGSMKENDDQFTPEDKHLVPLGDDAWLSGLQIHANIIAMLLDGTHLRKMADWVVWVLAFSICWLLMLFLVWDSQPECIWSEFRGKLIQIGTVVVIGAVALLLFQFKHVQLNTLPVLVPLALTADVLLFYRSFILWLSSKRRLPYKSYFK